MKLVDNWKRAWSWFSVQALAILAAIGPRLVSNWKSAWRWISVQVLLILAALPFVWPQIPPEVQAWIPEAWRPWIVAAIAIGGVAGRLIPQSKQEA
jgi:hypothetical protein